MPEDIQQPIKPVVPAAAPAAAAVAPAAAAVSVPAAVSSVTEPAPENEITLERYAIARSKTCGRAVEALNAFAKSEKRAGNHKATRSAYDARYEAFMNQPV
jgi:hypothetical protein